MPLAAPGLTLADKQAVNRALLACGATINEMNAVRRHLSAVKGGRLAAAAHPARVVTLAISDVPGDDPAAIASGPTVPDPSRFEDARAIVARYGIPLPDPVRAHLDAAAEETPKPGDPRLARAEYRLIATPLMALQAAAREAEALGLTPLILGDALEGEAREAGTLLAGIARSTAAHGHPVRAPAVLLSGGETTVTLGSAPRRRRPQRRVPPRPRGRARRPSRHLVPHGATPTASTAPRATPAPSPPPTPSPAPSPPASTRARPSPPTAATTSSRGWTTSSPPAPP